MQVARTRHSKSRAKAEINVVPYIDVMLVLLVIFIATAPVVMQGVTVDLPQAQAETMNQDERTPIIATVDKAGQFYVSMDTSNVKMNSLDELTNYVAEELSKDPTRPVVVQGDAQVAYDNVIQLMNALKNSGVKSVGLVTDPISN
jgi:biopolymer transport protein TolR